MSLTENIENALKEAREGRDSPHQETLNSKRYAKIHDSLTEAYARAAKAGGRGVATRYKEESGRTAASGVDTLLAMDEDHVDQMHACMGLSTEVGELTDIFKRHIFYGTKIDEVNLSEEVGDILWYLNILFRQFDLDIEEIMLQNLSKLRARFPDKFTSTKATVRDLGKERKTLEG